MPIACAHIFGPAYRQLRRAQGTRKARKDLGIFTVLKVFYSRGRISEGRGTSVSIWRIQNSRLLLYSQDCSHSKRFNQLGVRARAARIRSHTTFDIIAVRRKTDSSHQKLVQKRLHRRRWADDRVSVKYSLSSASYKETAGSPLSSSPVSMSAAPTAASSLRRTIISFLCAAASAAATCSSSSI